MQRFKNFIKGYAQLIAWCMATGIALPSALHKYRVDPPWPEGHGVVLITALVGLVTLGVIYQISKHVSRRTLRFACLWSAALLFIFCAAYFFIKAQLVFVANSNGVVLIKGLVCREDVARIYKGDCPLLSPELIDEMKIDPEKAWTASSITAARMLLLLAWTTNFFLLAVFLGSFLVLQEKRKR